VKQSQQNFGFAGTKEFLTIALEYLSDGHLSGLGDFLIGIKERDIKSARQSSANGGLAGSHHANKHDRAL
jgi:hypothetical protein